MDPERMKVAEEMMAKLIGADFSVMGESGLLVEADGTRALTMEKCLIIRPWDRLTPADRAKIHEYRVELLAVANALPMVPPGDEPFSEN